MDEHQQIADLESEIDALKDTISDMEATIAERDERIDELENIIRLAIDDLKDAKA